MACLITGASSGIGLELARVAARNRNDLVLVARSEGKLSALREEVERMHGVGAHVLAIDLAEPRGGAHLANAIATLGIEVDILVNNAGYGTYGPFLETDLDRELQMIQLNVATVTELTKRLLPPMVARGRGRVMNVASTAAFFPGPLMAVYYATKAYVLSFTEAIAEELAGSGVTVTALCPGPTESGFQAAAKQESSRLVAGRTLATSAQVAEAGWRAMMAGRTVEIPGVTNKLTAAVPRFLPRGVLRKAVKRAQDKRES